jgi:branched-chain amino acid transport system substrate-binding protein
MVYIGPYNSGAAKISMPILNNADLLMISPTNTWPGLTKADMGEPNEPDIYRPSGRLNYTRVVPTDDRQGEVAAGWAKEMGIEKAYILDDGEVYGRGIATMFNEGCLDHDLQVLGHESIDPKAQEFRSLMITIKAAGPDLVYFGGTTQSKGGQIAKDMVAAGIDAKLMVPDGCYEQAFIQAAGAENLNDRCFLTFGGVPPDRQVGKGQEFVEKYRNEYGADPEAYAIYAYEAAQVALQAIDDAGAKDRRRIIDAALQITNFTGALGKWSFDENGDTDLSRMSGIAVRSGQFEFVKLLGE